MKSEPNVQNLKDTRRKKNKSDWLELYFNGNPGCIDKELITTNLTLQNKQTTRDLDQQRVKWRMQLLSSKLQSMTETERQKGFLL